MNIVFFDTETTGVVDKTQKVLSKQPHIVQWAHITDKEKVTELFNPGVSIPQSASKIHWITDDAVAFKPLFTSFLEDTVLPLFESVDVIVAHNAAFDMNVLYFEAMRISTAHNNFAERVLNLKKKVFCTMQATTDVVQIPAKRWFKRPSLQELHQYCFGEKFEDGHDALVDIKNTAKCFHHLVDTGVFVLENWSVRNTKKRFTP